MRHYQYMKHCAKCADGKQLGQNAVCPIHKESTSTMSFAITLDWPAKPIFVDPAMS